MKRKLFTEEQQQLLRQNPYIYSVTDTRIVLTKEFKEIYMVAYKAGESPGKIRRLMTKFNLSCPYRGPNPYKSMGFLSRQKL